MLRFAELGAISGGLPYVNTDFSDILQQQHLESYRALLDSMNDASYDRMIGGLQYTPPPIDNNSGVILSGCDILSSDGTQYQIGFTNSIVYINGEFYQKDISVATISTINNSTFYIVPGPTVSECRILRDLITSDAIVTNTRYFVYTTTQPNEPHIKFSCRGTSRYFKRLLKYYTTVPGEVCMTTSLQNFSATGLGFNDMEGFVLLNETSEICYPNQFMKNFSGQFVAYGDGNGGFSTLRCKSTDYNQATYPNNCDYQTNESVKLSLCHLATHSHTTTVAMNIYPSNFQMAQGPSGKRPNGAFITSPILSTWNQQRCNPNTAYMEHSHYINLMPAAWCISGQGWNYYEVYNRSNYQFSEADGENTFPASEALGSLVSPHAACTNTGEDANINGGQWGTHGYTGGIYDYPNSNLAKHTHGLNVSLGNGVPGDPSTTSHENRPPYYVVAYYTKKL
jgi:hypothetical protein